MNFTAADNLSGVASVTAPISITTEGKSQVVNGSATDFAGNTGLASTSANIDKTPPEAFNQFDPVTHDIVLFGRDSLSGVAPGPIQPFSIAPIFGSPTASVRAELRSYRVLDLAGNSLILTERVLHLTNIVATTVVSLQYGQASLVNLPFNIETYAWASNPDGSIQILAQFLQAGSGEEDPRFTGVFTSLKNMTAIEQEEPEPETIRQTAGLALLRMATQTGKLSIEY